MKIRNAELTDANDIANVHIESWQHAYRGLLPDSILDSLNLSKRTEMWQKTLSEKKISVLVACDNEELVGFCSFGPVFENNNTSSSTGEIYGIYVLSEYWRQGIGKSLMKQALRELRSTGFSEIILWVFRDNPSAHRFYDSMGFSIYGDEKPHPKYNLPVVCFRCAFP